ncbi:unnamed protein product [Arabidopsis thaliana]|uniref:Mitochondrial uncoupling protein 3 n=1 Tax=Arabidopsis thaliana TaxID=3702 RepID=A0A5S9UBL5_ARATH|nr:unnamed protein product [Arabidopsis thaliana]
MERSRVTREAPTGTRILLASLSAMVAESVTFPIDLTKTRMQLHGSGSASGAHRIGAFGVVSEIARKEGVIGLYKGLSPAIIRHLFYTPIRIIAYENLKGLIVRSETNNSESLPLATKALVGGFSGVIAQVVASPADLVKVRMQADGRLVSQGLKPRYSGPIEAFTKILQSEGVKGLWKGVLPNIQRAFLVNMGELACYDHAKHFVIDKKIAEDNIFAHTLASIMSGLASTSLSCPADVVKTRMMNQGENAVYRNSYDCLVKTVKFEGIRALWKGFFPTWARLGPWQFVFWVSYEKFRLLAGISSF